ncbi:hypothetical protein Tco_1000898, partial [Tanacetum coccineum]
FSLWFYTSSKTKLIAKCSLRPEKLKEQEKGKHRKWKRYPSTSTSEVEGSNCPWRCYGKEMTNEKSFQVISMTDEHSCVRHFKSYGKAILESNPSSTVKVGVTVNPDDKTYFDRFYVCFKDLKDGWKLGCRKVIALDGCFLKKPNVGEILTAIGREANNHIFSCGMGCSGSENRPPMLNKENYVPWSSRLLRYAKSRPNGKLIYNSIINGPYVTEMISLNQTILLGLPEDIYAAVDSCETAQEIWLRVQQMMKGSDIGIQEKKAKLFNEWERFTSTDGESIESYYHRFSKLMNDFKRNKHFPEKIASNLKSYNFKPKMVGVDMLPLFIKQRTCIQQITLSYCSAGMNLGQDNQMQMVGGNALVVGEMTRVYKTAISNGINGNQIRCYNCKGVDHYATNCTVKPRKQDAAYLHKQMQIAQKEEAGIQLTSEEFYFMVAAGSCEETERANTNCTLENNLQQASTSVEQHYATVEETRAYHEALFHNLAAEVEKVNLVNRKMKETNAELTTKLARYKNQEKYFEISQEKYDKLERCYQKSVYQEKYLTKKINALHLSSGKQITALNEEISNLNNQLLKKKSTVSSLQEEKKRLKSDFNIRKDEFLDKQIQLENKIKELDNILVKQQAYQKQQSLYNGKVLLEKHDPPAVYDLEETLQLAQESRIERLQAKLGDLKGKSKDTPGVSDTLDPLSQKLENENIELEFQVRSYERENAHLKTAYTNLFDFINVTRTQTKTNNFTLYNQMYNDTIYENAKLRAQLFDKVFERKDTTKGTSVNTQFCKQSILGKPPSSSGSKLYFVTPFLKSKGLPKIDESHALSKPVTSNSVPTPTESKVMKNDNVISLGFFRINPFKASRNDVNSKTNGFSPKDIKNTTRTRTPQPRNNPKNDKVPSKSKSSWLSNNLEKIEENNRNLQSSSNQKHMSSECNNIKLAIRNAKSEVVCAMCDNACTSNPHELISKRFPKSTFSMTGCQNWFDTLLIPLLTEYKPKDKENHGDNECDI